MPDEAVMPQSASEVPDFPLFDSGSFFGLEKSKPRQWFERLTLRQRILLAISVTWIPMAILAVIQGVAIGHNQPRSFLADVGIYARLFVALPLFIAAPSIFHRRSEQIVRHFMNAGLVRDADKERFLAIVASTVRLRYSRVADWTCLMLAYLWSGSMFLIPGFVAAFGATWRNVGTMGHTNLSWAEWYFALVSQPIYAYVVVHFLYRVALWWRIIWLISRLDLALRGAHPDGAGGLMFVAHSLEPSRYTAFALSSALAGGLANIVLATGQSVRDFRYVIAGIAGVITVLFAGPLCFFNDQLRRKKVEASLSHDRTMLEQLRQFEHKWIAQTREANLLEVPDFSAVIDLNSSVATVHSMGTFPIPVRDLIELIVASLLPFLPVLALQIPIKDLLALLRELV